MTILVTRPEPAASELVARLRTQGKLAWSLPLIEFTPGRDVDDLPQQLSDLQPDDLVFLLSQQVVTFAHPALQRQGFAWPTQLDYYAIGRSTALALHTVSNLKVDYPHARETSEELVRLNRLQKVSGKRALILRGSPGRELLADTLTERGVDVRYCECYQRCEKYYDGAVEGRRWRDRGITTLVVTSGEMLQQLFGLFPPIDRREWLLHCRLLVVSERLATLAASMGWQDIEVADGADNDALLRALR
ncbi:MULTISPECIES: uroporphyrinogen-III synthase [Pantoea]|uniref:Uroporphyrinogen-III synthase n=1 Tax=Pantoea cypripedii TaxID=55209 RepID=A0A1X1EQ10_PANCY|nr:MULTISPECIES: uroporphyrinogen-III synthase [Pantoea]MBP2195953.1 uroporphyrinogen-III synthase [Pantoea cypripedii]MDE1188618.1 uroporphyrinogen-III synthase [Pantoea sp.]ORM91925.1 uroporphyrinogen-III synthase [Pantoea cypripedii]